MKQKSLLFTNFIRLGLISALLIIVSGLYAQEISELVFRNPVLKTGTTLKDGAAEDDKQIVNLTWTTGQERSLSHFTIEKSVNGVDFSEIAIVFANDQGAVRNQYSF